MKNSNIQLSALITQLFLRTSFPQLIASLLLTTTIGYISGRIHESFRKIPNTPLVFAQDTRPKVPVVMIDAVHDGNIEGSSSGSVRIFGEGHIVVPKKDGSFRIPLSDLRRTVEIRVPPDAKFAASKNGKKYYDITSAAAARLKPETRLYFRSAQEAEQAGYRK